MGLLARRLPLITPVLLLAACEASRFEAARREDSVAAYRRFLVGHPEGPRAIEAQRRLEELDFLRARRADRPFAFRQHLQQYPQGRYFSRCQERLAALALGRARSAADLMLVVERHPGSAEAAQALRRLPELLAAEALASSSAAVAQRFLDRHPDAAQAPAVRAHLARLRYPLVPDEALALESFAESFAGTAPAEAALQRLERILAAEVKEAGEPELLLQFRARFPGSQRLPELERVVAERSLRRALASLDLARLGELAAGGGEGAATAAQVQRWCRSRVARCKALAALAAKAGPYRPALSLEAARSKVYDPDPTVAWRAMWTLALLEDGAAGALLVELSGAERFSTVWLAEAALVGWLERRGQARRSFLTAELRRPYREVNDDERQRRGLLLLLAGEDADGQRLLGSLLERPARQLPAAYLLLRHARRLVPPAGGPLLGRFASAARTRLRWLEQTFPAEVNEDSLAAAALAEHELFALDRSLVDVKGNAPITGELLELQRLTGRLLARWRLQLGKARPGYLPAQAPGPEAAEEAHRRGQAAARARLAADPSPVAKLVLEAICESRSLGALQAGPGCPSAKPSYNRRQQDQPHGK